MFSLFLYYFPIDIIPKICRKRKKLSITRLHLAFLSDILMFATQKDITYISCTIYIYLKEVQIWQNAIYAERV